MNKVVTIHQPYYLPWLGYLHKVSQADVFIILDTVQFKKNSFINRVQIKSDTKPIWLTVPVKKHILKTPIKDIEISSNQEWVERQLNQITSNYKKAKYFDLYFSLISEKLRKDYKSLSELNIALIKLLLKCYSIETKLLIASDIQIFNIKGGTEITLELSKTLNAETYLSGQFGKNYLDLSKFDSEKIKVIFHSFQHPLYSQIKEPFLSGLSSIDLLFNYGENAKDVLFNKNKI